MMYKKIIATNYLVAITVNRIYSKAIIDRLGL